MTVGIFSRRRGEAPDPIGAISASGAIYRVSSYADSAQLQLQRQQWQNKAYRMYDAEGHLYYATNYVGSAMSRTKLVAARRPPKDAENQNPVIIPSGPFADAVRNIRSPRGGQSGLLRQIGRNVFLVGEVWLIASAEALPDGSVNQTWDAVSINELTTAGSNLQFMRRRLPGQSGERIPEGALTIRVWKEHPEWSDLADAGTRSAMGLLEKIVALNKAEYAAARSRLAGSGILALPQELVPPAWQNQGQNPDAMQSNPLYQALAESMTAPLRDEDHPSAVVPLLLVGPGAVIANMKYEPMSRAFDTQGMNESIKIAIEQVANTLELPKEVLLGAGEATHWTAWSIREDTFQAHIQPLLELACGALSKTYLKQAISKMSQQELDVALKASGVDDPNDIMVWYDASQLVILPDKAAQADGLHDRFIISDEALRREHGFSEDDKPSEEEYAKRVGIKMADAKMALTGKPTEQPAPGAPKSINGPRGQSPQGPGANPPASQASRRATAGLPQDSATKAG